ncbi:MAG TPA: alpha-E domain-containing protein [Bacillales bacterium]|nr:alpha-E domain-containing protein [Bacillales bacterium]
MLSRVANSLYWLSRNVERAENNTRLIEMKWISLLENVDKHSKDDQNWSDMVQICGDPNLFTNHYADMNAENALDFITFSDKNGNSILKSIQISRDNARVIREIIPQELWELINTSYWDIRRASEQNLNKENITDFLKRVKNQSLRLQGIIEATMPRDEAYLFIQMGKYLERADKMARILDVYYHRTNTAQAHQKIVDYHHWWAVLQSVSGHDAFLKKHRSFINGERVIYFLIVDPVFPRSISFCMDRLMEAFMEHENGEVHAYSLELYQLLNQLKADLLAFSVDQQPYEELQGFLHNLRNRFNEIGQLILKTYYLGALPAL